MAATETFAKRNGLDTEQALGLIAEDPADAARVRDAMLDLAALSFLGLGVQPPTADWGTMLSEGQLVLLNAPHLAVAAGSAIVVAVLGFNLLGDGLRDVLDPRQAQR